MTQTEFYAWVCIICVAAFAWLAGGIVGVICFLVGVFVSQVDIGWIDDLKRVSEPDPVVPVQRVDPGNLDRDLGWQTVAPAGMVKKERRTVLIKRKKKLPPNVVVFPRKAAN